MNIFITDESPAISARNQHDRHVVKMTLESAQLLSTACHMHEGLGALYNRCRLDMPAMNESPEAGTFDLYKVNHANHPCSIWARECMSNFAWLTLHLKALLAEYNHRFGKTHGCDRMFWIFGRMLAKHYGVSLFTQDAKGAPVQIHPTIRESASLHSPFVFCGPEDCRDARGVVESYRALYQADKIFQSHVKWTRRELPAFLRLRADDDTLPVRIREQIKLLQSANLLDNDESRAAAANAAKLHRAALTRPDFSTMANADRVRMPTRFGSK